MIQPSSLKTISIVIPAKDEEGNIKILIRKLKSLTKKRLSGFNIEVIVVCPSENDKTLKVAKEMGIRTLVENNNPSKSNATVLGFRNSKGRILSVIDADLSQPPEEIPIYLKNLISDPKIGMVTGSRKLGGSEDGTTIRDLGGKLLSLLFNVLMDSKYTDVLYGLKVFKREIFEDFKYNSRHFGIDIELLANAHKSGMKVLELPSFEKKRWSGKVKAKTIKNGFTNLYEILRQGIKYRLSVISKRH